MAVGDAPNVLARLRANLPPWFPNQGFSPVLDGALTAIATVLAFIYSLYAYAVQQTRISTATDAWLDLIAWDYFGGSFGRNPGEADGSFRGRLLAQIILPRVTRAAIQAALEELTGYPVRVIEPFALTDTGFWKVRGSGAPISFYDVNTVANPALWSGRGLRCMFFIQCALPPIYFVQVMPVWGVRGDGAGTYGSFWQMRGGAGATASGIQWLLRSDVATVRGENPVYALINAMRAAGVTCWVQFVPIVTNWDEPGTTWDSGIRWDQ